MGIRGYVRGRVSTWRAERAELKKIKAQSRATGKMYRQSDRWKGKVAKAKEKGFSRGRYGLFGGPKKKSSWSAPKVFKSRKPKYRKSRYGKSYKKRWKR